MPARLRSALLLVLALSPALAFLIGLPRFGACQYNDYYGIIGQLWAGSGFTRDPVRWLTLKSNEHTIALPALVFLANIHLTHGDNRGLAAFSIALLFATFFLLRSWMRRDTGPPEGDGWASAFLLAAAVFSPVIAESVVIGFIGTIWLLSNVLAMVALSVLAHRTDGRWTPAFLAILVGLCGALSYTTNLPLWPALLAVALLQRRRPGVAVAIAGTGVAVLLLFLLGFHRLPYHPRPETAHPAVILLYTAIYLGGFLAATKGAAALLGMAGLLASAGAWWCVLRRGRGGRPAPWIGLGIFSVGNALITAVGRAGFGLTQALASRYDSVAALFWISLAAGISTAVHGRARGREGGRSRAAALGLSLALGLGVALSWAKGLPVYASYLRNARRQPLAAEALRLGVYDLPAIRVLSRIPVTREQVETTVAFLEALGHVPFDRPAMSWTALPEEAPLDGPQVEGAVERAVRVDGETLRVSGWIDERVEVREILVTTVRGRPLARMVLGLPDPVGGDTGAAAGGRAYWAGYVRPGPDIRRLLAVALVDGRWERVPGELLVPPRIRSVRGESAGG